MSAKSALSSLKGPGIFTLRVDRDTTIYGLGEPLILSGHYTCHVLKGGVNIGGTNIPASQDGFPVSCPQPPYYCIKPAHAANELNFLGDDAEQFADFATVIRIQKRQVPDLSLLAPPFKALFPAALETVPAGAPIYEPHKSWRQLDGQVTAGDRIVLVGPKNSGKSTLARFLCNQRTSRGQTVHYLDLDPGQGEYTPPGTLALHRLTAPSFCPPYMHCDWSTVIKAHSLGYPSPMETPERYVAMCKELLTTYSRLPERHTLIVNTPGWTKGLGLELNIEVCQMVEPMAVAHMGHDESFDELREAVEDISDEVVVVEPVDVVESSVKFSAAELRTLQTISYFHTQNIKPLPEWSPYQVPYKLDRKWLISGIAIVDGFGIDPQDTHLCVSGTIVAINAVTGTASPADIRNGIPLIAPGDAMNLYQNTECLGYAVVQSLCDEWIRLLTPMDPAVLGDRQVIISRGRLGMPVWLLWDHKTNEAPWLTARASAGIGGAYSKFRRNIQRR